MSSIDAVTVGEIALIAGFPENQTALTRIIAIGLRESGGNGSGPCDCDAHYQPCSPGDTCGSVHCENSFGVWQINYCAWGGALEGAGILHGPPGGDAEELLNCDINAQAMVWIYNRYGESPWRGTSGVSQAAWDEAKQAAPKAIQAFNLGRDISCETSCKGLTQAQKNALVQSGVDACVKAGGDQHTCQTCLDCINQLVDIGKGVVSHFNVITDIIGAVVALANTFKHFFEWIQNPLTWKILGLSVAGGLLLLFGLGLLAFDAFSKHAPSIAGTIAKGVE